MISRRTNTRAVYAAGALHQAGFASKILRGLGASCAGMTPAADRWRRRLVNCVWKTSAGKRDGADNAEVSETEVSQRLFVPGTRKNGRSPAD